MRDVMSGKKFYETMIFATIARVKCNDFAIEVFFHYDFESYKDIMNIGFELKWI